MKDKKKHENKKLKNNNKVERSKSFKVVITICRIIFVFWLIAAILGCFSSNFQLLFWKYFLNPVNDIIFFIGQYIQIKVTLNNISITILLIIAWIVLVILIDQYSNNKKITKEKKYIVVNRLRILYSVLSTILIFIFLNLLVFCNNNPKLDTIYFSDQVNKNYTLEQFRDTFIFLEGKVVEMAQRQQRDDDGHIKYSESDIENMAVADLMKASSNYDVLKGIYPTHYYRFDSHNFSVDPSLYGLTTMDSVGINYNQEAPQLLNTITHELCHIKGVTRENEAVLCSVMAGFESDNYLSNYAAYFESYLRFLDAYEEINYDEAIESENRVLRLCFDNNYQETCNLYRKDVNYYVQKSDSIVIRTFTLNNYEEKFLKDVFNNLRSYDLKLSIDDKNVSENEVFNEEYQNKCLKLVIKNDKKIFSEITDYLKSNKDQFVSVGQTYPMMYVGVDFTRSEAINYYTSPIPNSNFIDSFNRDKIEELFDYSRSARLIMEYFDAKNIG